MWNLGASVTLVGTNGHLKISVGDSLEELVMPHINMPIDKAGGEMLLWIKNIIME